VFMRNSTAEDGVDSQSRNLHNSSHFHKEGTPHRRPKLLFLARSFPPLRTTACVRTWNIAKHLARLGWDVTVVTPHSSVWRYVESIEEINARLKREGIRRLLTGHRWRCLAPTSLNCRNQGPAWLIGGVCRTIARCLGVDDGIGWAQAAERACATLTADDVDVILATGSPFTTFGLAKRLSDKLSRPYVLDYRDPWTGNPHVKRPDRPAIIRKEASLLSSCAAVTIVSPSWGVALDKRFSVGAKLHVVTNGYDPEELADVKPTKFDHFAVVYAGNFYPPKRIITPVMAVLQQLKEIRNGNRTDWYFHYYGKHGSHIREEAQHFDVMERVVLHGSVPRTEALAAVCGASVAVVITSVAEEAMMEDRGIVPGKVFETLGLGTPILLIAPPQGDVATIAETTALARRFIGSDIDGMTLFLAEAMRGQHVKSGDCETYAWTNIAKKMDVVLRTTLKMAPGDQGIS
jgi:glycosyltransferase involved in cell wall biosynthesis